MTDERKSTTDAKDTLTLRIKNWISNRRYLEYISVAIYVIATVLVLWRCHQLSSEVAHLRHTQEWFQDLFVDIIQKFERILETVLGSPHP